MLRPTVTKIRVLRDYHMELTFNNGEVRDFNAAPYIIGDWYGELNDPAYFSSAITNGYNIEWPNGQDICPDDLYYNSVPCGVMA